MKRKVLNTKSNEEIIEIINKLSSYQMRPSSHGYNDHKGKSIGEASKISISDYTSKAIKRPAVALIDVVLAANRNYNKAVEPKIKHILNNSDIATFKQLDEFMTKNSKETFFNFWGHQDNKKYNILRSILDAIKVLKGKKNTNDNIKDDYDLMNKWAIKANIEERKDDPIGRIENIGIATFQHLRMVFGANTVKPDQRVIEVLEREFELMRVSQLNAIKAVEYISKITNKSTLEIDQIFVKYGSGYYNLFDKENRQIKKGTIEYNIALKLKEKNISNDIILYSTGINL